MLALQVEAGSLLRLQAGARTAQLRLWQLLRRRPMQPPEFA
jgi:hypothetical protein